MELPIDAHTHRVPETPSQAIINIRWPEVFNPQPGQYYSLGIHPWDVQQFVQEKVNWKLFKQLARHPQVVAIGECGIDKHVHRELLLLQDKLFTRQAVIADNLKKPIIVHNVRSIALIRFSKELTFNNIPWVLHGFRGKAEEALNNLPYGFYLSFGPQYNADALRAVPIDRLLVETDDSGLGIDSVYRSIAAVRGIEVDELILHVKQNMQRLFFKGEEL